ncbi:MAG: TonB-dependent receptor [Deltaproteobacteria bacterium]|nr:TonB-dependent receptor [Deltaproteobacteria bacterium]
MTTLVTPLGESPLEGRELGDLGEIQVTDKQREGRLDGAAFSNVLTSRDLEGRTLTLPEVLSEEVGLQVRRYGGLDDFATLSIRGSTSEQVQIYLDGVPINAAQGGAVNIASIPLSQIEKIEIYRGQTPSFYETSAIGGVVAITTKRFHQKPQWAFDSSYGSWNSAGAGVFGAIPVGSWGSSAGYHFQHSDGDFQFLDDNGTPFNASDDQTRSRKNNSFNRHSFLTHWNGSLGHGWHLQIHENFFREDRGVPGLGTLTSETASLATTRSLTQLELTQENLFDSPLGGTPLALSFIPSFGYTKSQFSDPQGEIGLGRQDNDDDSFLYGLKTRAMIPLGNHHKAMNTLSYQGEQFLPENRQSTPGSDASSRRDSIGLVVEDEIRLLNGQLTLLPSFRMENIFNNENNLHLLGGKLGVKLSLGASPLGEPPSGGTPFSSGLAFKANGGRSYRAPSFSELFGDRGFFVGNPDLQPEKSVNFDLGLLWTKERWHFEISYFQNEIRDLIQMLQTSQYTVQAQNLGRARIQGMELVAQIKPIRPLTLTLNYTYEQAKDVSGNPATQDLLLPGRPIHELSAKTDYQWHWARFFSDLNFIDANFLDTQNIRKVNHRIFWNVGTEARFLKYFSAAFEVKNVLNDQTVDIVGFPLPGRGFFGKLEMKN